jgi:hypothetical protein
VKRLVGTIWADVTHRAEFSQAVNILGQFSGPRIVELDASGVSCDGSVTVTKEGVIKTKAATIESQG